MNQPMFRWGILGAAQIAKKNWQAIRNTNNGVVAAVASRDLQRSRRFIGECQAEAGFETAPRAVAGYEELITARDVDGLYIPLPTGIRKEWVLRAAAAGKHVVCEKPCASSVADLTETNLFQAFVAQVQSGQLNPAWPEAALKTQQVLQACRESALAGGKLLEIRT